MTHAPTTLTLFAACALLAPAPAAAQSARDRAEARNEIRRFASDEREEIVGALKTLLAMGERAVPELVRALKDKNAKVATYCGSTLSRIGEPAIPALIGALDETHEQARREAYSALVRIGEPVIPAVEEAVRSGSPRVREAAVAVLTQLGRTPPAEVKPTPAPSAQPTATPQPSATPQPAREAQNTPVPSLIGQAPPEPSVPGAQSDVDEARRELGDQMLERLRAHVEAGEHAQARAILWGLWAQAKRERLWTRRWYGGRRQAGLDRRAEIDARYGQARDLVYGSTPPLAPDDDGEAVAALLQCADGAMGRLDMSTARIALQHARNRQAAGVALTPQVTQQLNQLLERYNQHNKTVTQALFDAMNAFVQRVQLREGLSPEGQLHALYAKLQRVHDVDARLLALDRRGLAAVNAAHEWVLGLRLDLPGLVEALPAFAAAAPDPEFADSVLAKVVAKQPKSDFYASFSGGLRLAVYGELLFERWKVDDTLGGAWLTYTDRCLDDAETATMRDNGAAAEAKLTEAATSLGNARTGGAGAEAIALREARAATLRASAGMGKFKRAVRLLDEADEDYARASQEGSTDAWEDGNKALESAQAWLVEARAGGLTPADESQAQSRVQQTTTRGGEAGAALVLACVARAGELLQEAQGLLDDGASAWRAIPKVERAERERAQAEAALTKLPAGHAQRASLQTQLAQLGARVEGMGGQVVAAQRLPQDSYQGGDGERWRREIGALLASEREWEVLGMAITSPEWKDKEARYEYRTGANEITVETRWYRQLFAWVALADPEDPSRVGLRYLGFRLHKYTDGSYRKLKLFYVDAPVPMLRANLPE